MCVCVCLLGVGKDAAVVQSDEFSVNPGYTNTG